MSTENTIPAVPVEKKEKKVKGLNFRNFSVGLITALLSQPFEVTRTSSITSLKTKKNNLAGTIEVMKQIFQKEGMRGFFRGGLVSLGKSSLASGVFYSGLENVHFLTNHLRDLKYIPGNAIDFLNACCSRTMTTLIVNPINIIKTRFEVVGSEHNGVGHAIRSVYEKQGLRGFYRGILPTLMRDVPYSGLQYSSYRFLMSAWEQNISPNSNPYASTAVVTLVGATSSIFAVMATYPFDNIRVRFQTHDLVQTAGVQTQTHMPGLVSLVGKVWKEEGLKGFYLGYVPRLMKKCTATTVSWVVYEKLRKVTY